MLLNLVMWWVGGWALGAQPLPSVQPWAGLSEETRNTQVERLLAQPMPERLLLASEGFLGVPYGVSPLGEGFGPDADPLLRFDLVDCLTFVEQAMALSLLKAPGEWPARLSDIRYLAEVSYAQRNHLMEADWIPHNLKKGLLVDVTRHYAGDDARLEYKQLSPKTWRSKTSRRLALPPERQVQGRFPLSVLPLGKVARHIGQVPSGTLVMVVREERESMPTRITHLGFLVQKKRPYLRHASRTFGRVVDEPLDDFLRRNERYEKWRVVGVSLFAVEPAFLAAAPAR